MTDETKAATPRTALSIIAGEGVALVEEFSRPVKTIGGETAYRFGIDTKASDALRRLADEIDAKGSIVTSLELTSRASSDDWLLHTLSVEFALASPVGDKS